MIEKIMELYKDIYYKELIRKEEIHKNLTIPIGILIALIGAISYFYKQLIFECNFTNVLQIEILIFFFFSIIVTIYYLIRIFYSYEYKYISDPEEMEKYRNELIEYYKSTLDNIEENQSFNDFNLFLINQYVQTSTFNIMNNDRKVHFLFLTKRWLIITIISFLLSCILSITINFNYK